MSSIVSIT